MSWAPSYLVLTGRGSLVGTDFSRETPKARINPVCGLYGISSRNSSSVFGLEQRGLPGVKIYVVRRHGQFVHWEMCIALLCRHLRVNGDWLSFLRFRFDVATDGMWIFNYPVILGKLRKAKDGRQGWCIFLTEERFRTPDSSKSQSMWRCAIYLPETNSKFAPENPSKHQISGASC